MLFIPKCPQFSPKLSASNACMLATFFMSVFDWSSCKKGVWFNLNLVSNNLVFHYQEPDSCEIQFPKRSNLMDYFPLKLSVLACGHIAKLIFNFNSNSSRTTQFCCADGCFAQKLGGHLRNIRITVRNQNLQNWMSNNSEAASPIHWDCLTVHSNSLRLLYSNVATSQDWGYITSMSLPQINEGASFQWICLTVI